MPERIFSSAPANCGCTRVPGPIPTRNHPLRSRTPRLERTSDPNANAPPTGDRTRRSPVGGAFEKSSKAATAATFNCWPTVQRRSESRLMSSSPVRQSCQCWARACPFRRVPVRVCADTARLIQLHRCPSREVEGVHEHRAQAAPRQRCSTSSAVQHLHRHPLSKSGPRCSGESAAFSWTPANHSPCRRWPMAARRRSIVPPPPRLKATFLGAAGLESGEACGASRRHRSPRYFWATDRQTD